MAAAIVVRGYLKEAVITQEISVLPPPEWLSDVGNIAIFKIIFHSVGCNICAFLSLYY